jgi:hypothetical protein
MKLIYPEKTPIKAGSKVILACTATSSNPSTQISWFKNSYAILFDNSTDTKTNLTSSLGNDYETISYVEVRRDIK